MLSPLLSPSHQQSPELESLREENRRLMIQLDEMLKVFAFVVVCRLFVCCFVCLHSLVVMGCLTLLTSPIFMLHFLGHNYSSVTLMTLLC